MKRIVEEAYARAKSIILGHRAQMDELAGQLYEKEVLFREDLERIYGPREADLEKQREEQKKLEQPTEQQDNENLLD